MSQVQIKDEGAFTRRNRKGINDNFTALFATQVGGSLDAGQIIVGDNTDTAAAVDMSGDVTIDQDGVTTIGAGKVTSAMLDNSVGHTLEVDLSAANIIALHSVPFTIVAAPGSGKAVIIDDVSFSMTYGSVQFTGGGVVQAQYHTDTANLLSTTVLDTSIKAAASFAVRIGAASTTNGVILLANKAVELIAASSDFAAGNSTAKVFVQYRIVTL